MRFLFLCALVVVVAACEAPAPTPDSDADVEDLTADDAGAETPKVYAVLFYADWCASCKTLDPKVEEAWPAFEEHPIARVTLDFTDETTTALAEQQAQDLGLGTVFEADAGGTGFVVLVDVATGEPLDRISKTDSVEEIQSKMNAALAQS